MDKSRLAEILREPRETLQLEIKEWLDPVDKEHRAIIAKAGIALANHGGGHILIGMTEDGDTYREAVGRPTSLDAFNTDWVNGIIDRFAEPAFHCEVRHVSVQVGGPEFPVVCVPGGHKVPIRAKRSGPGDKIINDGSYYTRRPGPKSEPPQSGRDWDDLIQRCIHNRRDEMLDHIRIILSGSVPTAPQAPEADALMPWEAEALRRWEDRLSEVSCPSDHPVRMPLGRWTCAYRIIGDVTPRRGEELLERLRQAKQPYTGWATWWIPTKPSIAPYPVDGLIECWIKGDDALLREDASHADFWRAAPDGRMFLIRGYAEDDLERIPPGQVFDVTLPVWRVGECLLHAAALTKLLTNGDDQAKIDIRFTWTGLVGRQLTSVSRDRWLEPRTSRQGNVQARGLFLAAALPDALPEAVRELTTPLYEVFDFFVPPDSLIVDELGKMRKNKF
jgi:transcriptional regulator with XRE-family HTH domain